MMKTLSPLRVALVAALISAMAGGTASALEIQGNGVPRLRTGTDHLTIGGMTGRSRTDPSARKCYGSTLCSESGTYYSEDGVLHYKNGDPLEQGKRPSGIEKAPPTGPSD